MIFGQVVPKNQPRCGNRTICEKRPNLIMQAYITLCFGISLSRALHQKSIVSTHLECQQTLYILCYKSMFKLCMIFIGIQELFILVGLGRSFFVCCLAHRGSTVGFLLLQCSSGIVRHPRDLQVSVATRFCRVLIFASS